MSLQQRVRRRSGGENKKKKSSSSRNTSALAREISTVCVHERPVPCARLPVYRQRSEPIHTTGGKSSVVLVSRFREAPRIMRVICTARFLLFTQPSVCTRARRRVQNRGASGEKGAPENTSDFLLFYSLRCSTYPPPRGIFVGGWGGRGPLPPGIREKSNFISNSILTQRVLWLQSACRIEQWASLNRPCIFEHLYFDLRNFIDVCVCKPKEQMISR